MCLSTLTLSSVLLAAGSAPNDARDDWPQWGGPARTGVSEESSWSAEGKAEPLWAARVGLGYSSVAVANGRLYTLGFDKDLELDVVHCLDAKTGAEVWTYAYPSKIWDLYHKGGTLTTPAVDGDVVYVAEREGRVHCFDAATGEVRWEKQLTKEHGLDVPQWGFSASPLVVGDALVLNYGKVIALDKKTGAAKWNTEKSYGDAYSTPIDFTYKGAPALAVFTGAGLAILSAKGDELALTPWKTKYDVNAMTPIVLGERMFISSGYDKGCALLDLSGAEPKIAWESKAMRNQMSGAVHWEGHLYGFDDKVLKCIDLAGEEKWRERGLGQGALSIAGGRLIVMSEDGELVVAAAKPAAFEELARTKVFDGGTCWTVPVLSDGIVYVRNQVGELAALDHRQR
jgi:outer membrane protein assembly factor BamB